jgi:NAD(P)-dependent dehydrogenase (short-subunit alcohol dehydrogenase family)
MIDYPGNNRAVALITGASKGLGLTLSRYLAAQGYALILNARDLQQLAAAQKSLAILDGTIQTIAGDVSDPNCRKRLVEAVQPFGRLDLLFNNASTLGPLPMLSLASYPLEELRQLFETNTIAPLALVQAMQPYLEFAAGLVVNISSDAALGGYEGWGGYGASKAALDLLSATLANELRPNKISIVSVDPGDMRTDMHQDAFPNEDISDRPLPDTTIPFWAWLLCQEAAHISGQRFQAQAELWQVLT